MSASLKVIDRDLALERAGGSLDLAQELFGMLLKELPYFRATLSSCHAAGDLQALQESVHKLNGSATYCGVPALKRAADSLESRLKRGDSDIAGDFTILLAEIDRVQREAHQGL